MMQLLDLMIVTVILEEELLDGLFKPVVCLLADLLDLLHNCFGNSHFNRLLSALSYISGGRGSKFLGNFR